MRAKLLFIKSFKVEKYIFKRGNRQFDNFDLHVEFVYYKFLVTKDASTRMGIEKFV